MTSFERMSDEELGKARASAWYLLSPNMRGHLPMWLTAPLSEFAADLGNATQGRDSTDEDTVDFEVPDYEALGFKDPRGTQPG